MSFKETSLLGTLSPSSATSTSVPSVQIQDGLGRTVMTINPEGHTATMAYDELKSAGDFQSPYITIPGTLLATSSTDSNGKHRGDRPLIEGGACIFGITRYNR